jgi:hypothetical protein
MKKNLFLRVGMCALIFHGALTAFDDAQIGREVAIPKHLQDGDEYRLPIRDLIDFGPATAKRHWRSSYRSAGTSRIPTQLQPHLRA